MPPLTTIFNIVFDVLARLLRGKKKEIKGIQIGKEDIKLTLFASYMILHIKKTLKISSRKWLELINEYSKVTEYEINTEKSLAFLYVNNEKSEREIKEAIPFTVATKIIKYLGINLHKRQRTCMKKNCKTLMNEIKDDTNRWKDIPCS